MMMRNNVVYEVVGIGNVRLKIHDESVIELRQVRHVPELKKQLDLTWYDGSDWVYCQSPKWYSKCD